MKITFNIYLSRRWPFSLFQKWGWLKERKMTITQSDTGVNVQSNCSMLIKHPPMIVFEDRPVAAPFTFYPKPD